MVTKEQEKWVNKINIVYDKQKLWLVNIQDIVKQGQREFMVDIYCCHWCICLSIASYNHYVADLFYKTGYKLPHQMVA